MPRREDERRLNLSKRHPEACTCKDCTDKFLRKKGIKTGGLGGKKKRGMEAVKPHPADCECASCSLLGSVDFSQVEGRGSPGIIKKLFGKK